MRELTSFTPVYLRSTVNNLRKHCDLCICSKIPDKVFIYFDFFKDSGILLIHSSMPVSLRINLYISKQWRFI